MPGAETISDRAKPKGKTKAGGKSRKPVTHTVLAEPRMSGRRLAEFMVASPIRQRTLIRDTKFRSVEPEISYGEGFAVVGDMLADGGLATNALRDAAEDFHDRMDVRGIREKIANDLIGDMLEWLADERPDMALPDAERYDDSRTWGRGGSWSLGGVVVDPEVHLRLRKARRSGTAGVGVVSLRYSKSADLKADVAEWQAALLHGYLEDTLGADAGVRADPDLSCVLDLRSGVAHAAPGRARTLFKQMEAACESVAERWANVAPPKTAVVGEPSDVADGDDDDDGNYAIPF